MEIAQWTRDLNWACIARSYDVHLIKWISLCSFHWDPQSTGWTPVLYRSTISQRNSSFSSSSPSLWEKVSTTKLFSQHFLYSFITYFLASYRSLEVNKTNFLSFKVFSPNVYPYILRKSRKIAVVYNTFNIGQITK